MRMVTRLLALWAVSLAVAANGYAADIEWEGWSFDYSTNSNSSGLVLTNVRYNGELILGRASMPVMRVEYENDICGPYADILSPSQLEPANSGAPNDVCDNQSVCRRSFTQDGERKFEIGSNWQIGEYQIYQTYYFSENGTIDSRVYSRGLQCVINHGHHAHWMFDFDIGDAENDRIARGDSNLQQTEFNDLRENTTYWTVEDPAYNTRVRLIPSDDDGEPNNFSRWDAAARKFNSGEVGRWRLGARGEIGDNYNSPAESIDGEDLVLWYVSHLPHAAAEGSSIWHASGPRIEVVTSEPAPEPEPEPEPEPQGDNLLVNGGFESAPALTGWANCGDESKTQVVTADREGASALRIFGGGCLYQEVNVEPGTDYQLTCDAQRSGNAWTILEFSFLDANFGVIGTKDTTQVNTSDDFRTYQFNGTAPADAVYALTLAYSEDETRVDACVLMQQDTAEPAPTPDPTPDPTPSDADNLLSNGGFEDRLNEWTSCAATDLLSESTDADTGNAALAVVGGGCIYQEFPVTPGVAYRMNCRAKRTDDSRYSSASLSMLSATYTSLDRQELPVQSDAFEDYSATVVATADSALGNVVLYSENPGVFDNCEVVATQ